MKMFRSLPIVVLIILFSINVTYGFDNFHAHHKGIEKLNYDSLFQTSTPLSKSPEGQALIDNCMTSYGGIDLLKKLESFHLVYDMEQYMTKGSINVDKYHASNRKYKIVKHQLPQPEMRTINGQDCWYEGRDTVLELNSGRYKAELFSYLTLTMPLALKTEPFDEIRYGIRNDDSLLYLYMKKDDSLLLVLGIDPKDYLIRKSEGIIYQDSDNFVFINIFSDFQHHQGYIFPHSLTNISMGLEVARSTITSIDINPKLDDTIFRPAQKTAIKQSY